MLEIGVFIAAPFAALQLADLGADVIKIESSAGEPVRASGPFVNGESSPFLRLNRLKRSVVLDLKSAGGKQAFLRLAATADVVIENLRPGAMRALGLSYDDVRAVNPRIVYASASGFGQDGPLADRPGLDIMAQARGGLMSITGSPDGPPAKIGVPICDLVSGLYVAFGVLAALRERERSGVGQYLDVSLLESGVSLAVWEAGRFFATGEIGRPLGTAHQSEAPYQAVRSADGWLTFGAITPKTWAGLCAALGLEQLEHESRFATSVDTSRPPAGADPVNRATNDDDDDDRKHRTLGARRGAVCPDLELWPGIHRRAPRGPRVFLGCAAPCRRRCTPDRLAGALVADQSSPRIGGSDARRRYPRGAA